MRCSNAPFTEYGQSEIIRDVEYLYMLLAGGTNDLGGQVALNADQTVGDDTVNGQGGVPSPADQVAANNALYLQISQDLADVHNAATARTNLAVLGIANNLSDLASAVTARVNIGINTFQYVPSTTSYQTNATGNARGSGAVDLQSSRSNVAHVASGASSFLAGADNTASGVSSVALGNVSAASGDYSVAVGLACTASNTSAVSIGHQNVCSASGSCALGDSNTVSGLRAVALGYNHTVGGTDSFTMGSNNNTHTAFLSMAFGYTNDVQSTESGAFGSNNAIGSGKSYAFTIGYNNNCSHNSSMVLGSSGSSGADNQLTLSFTGGIKTNGDFYRNGTQILNTQQAAVTAPTGGATIDSQARTAINDLISRLQAHGLIA